MAPSSTVMRPFLRQAAPGGSALAQALRGAQRQRPQFFQSQAFRFRNGNSSGSKRWQSTSGAGAEQQQQQSWFKRAWESEVGIKTVHFWAPVMKVRACLPTYMHTWTTRLASSVHRRCCG